MPGTKKKGLKLASQKAIIEHFVKLEKYILLQEFIEQPNKQSQLHKAIALCRKHKAIFIVATLDCISKDEHTIFSTKKKLGNLFRSCDLPTSDSLTLSIALGLQHRKFELASIKTKAALQACKVAGKQLGNTQNLTKEGRKMGLASITSKTTNTPRMEKVIRIIEKCRKAGMGWGSIARGLNESGYKTARGMEFSKMAVKRMRNG